MMQPEAADFRQGITRHTGKAGIHIQNASIGIGQHHPLFCGLQGRAQQQLMFARDPFAEYVYPVFQGFTHPAGDALQHHLTVLRETPLIPVIQHQQRPGLVVTVNGQHRHGAQLIGTGILLPGLAQGAF